MGTESAFWPLVETARRLGIEEVPESLTGLVADWRRWRPVLDDVVAGADGAAGDLAIAPREAAMLAPLQYPGKVLCAGANYYDHIAEMGVEKTDKKDQRLFFFFKPPRSAIVGPGPTVRMPPRTAMLDWEVELAVVLGRRVKNADVTTAMDAVAAVTVAIDLSARDLSRAPETFYKVDWVAGKAQDTCCPMGPWLVPSDQLPDLQDLELRLSVNGEIKQSARTSNMIFSIAEQIVTASEIMTLDPGDVVLTGTPAGVGFPKGTFLKVGDRIDAEIERIGTLTVEIAG